MYPAIVPICALLSDTLGGSSDLSYRHNVAVLMVVKCDDTNIKRRRIVLPIILHITYVSTVVSLHKLVHHTTTMHLALLGVFSGSIFGTHDCRSSYSYTPLSLTYIYSVYILYPGIEGLDHSLYTQIYSKWQET